MRGRCVETPGEFSGVFMCRSVQLSHDVRDWTVSLFLFCAVTKGPQWRNTHSSTNKCQETNATDHF